MLFFWLYKTFCSTLNSWIGKLVVSFFWCQELYLLSYSSSSPAWQNLMLTPTRIKQRKNGTFSVFPSCLVSHPLSHPTSCPLSCSGFWQKSSDCPVPRPVQMLTGCSSPSCPMSRFWACPVVPLSGDNDGTSVPLSQKVALSRPVGLWVC